MTDREARLAEAGRLAELLVGIVEQAKVDFAATVGALGLSVPLARAVVLLATPAPMRDLAERLHCDRSYITSLADQLEERGLVARVPGEDRRVKMLALTDEGAAVRGRIAEAVAERNMILHRLTDGERETLTPLLERLHGDGTSPAVRADTC
ncbi:DNA-binding MarR family transcriptional regulator [Hamadaea flava]|uniref:MarR family winged helix-turn-helix transcriptional regulator n=1 Tax=Hamadaea flava TaxID=1742688 RepID=A0ABV8LN04_9ACTN|nr:MarR family transcriptional regulator [Hamadaea flava]MCP2323007.1 DNA-binding MarR family transcriptional regulator [Hamadaea flava]